MIKSFKHKGLNKFYLTGSTAGIQAKHEAKLRRLLAQLNRARKIEDLSAPEFRLHPLKYNRKGVWAMTVQANWRVTFTFENGDTEIVNYEDYH